MISFVDAGATFDETRRYRYTLWRTWEGGPTKPHINFVMLNPSTADESVLDPTVTRCVNYAKDWGFGTLYVTNLFALRSTDPRELYSGLDPVGPANDEYIVETAKICDKVVVAWGVHGALNERGLKVAEMLAPFNPQCFALTKAGHPRHPLYLRKDAALMPFRISVARELAVE